MTTAMQPGGGRSSRPQPSGRADAFDTILDKGLVIGAYLRFAEAVNRLDISQEKEGLPGLVGNLEQNGAHKKTKGALDAAGEKLREFADAQGGDRSRRSRREGD